MTANPIDLVYVDGVPVSKADARGFEKLRGRQRVADASEIRNTKFSGQFGGLYRADAKTFWDIDTEDTTSPDDGINCIIDADGNRWKPVSSVPAPTEESLGGVFSHAPLAHEFLTGIDVDGTPLAAQPSASDLTNGVEGTGAVVLKSYADGLIDAFNALHYEGDIDCSADPDYPAADTGDLYIVSVAGKIGGSSGIEVDLGDWLVCKVDGSVSGDHATVGANWSVIQTNIVGAVTLTGIQTLSNKTISGADNTLNVRLGNDVSGNLPNANLAAMANGTIKGNMSGSSAVPSDVTPSQALDVIGATRGSVLYRGASGWSALVPGTNGQVLTSAGAGADPSYQDATGGGGGLSDTDRRNILLDRIYQSKLLGAPRRVVNSWATGFKAATDADRGINTGSSSNVDASNAAANGYVKPVTADTRLTGGTPTTLSGTAANINDNNPATSITWTGADLSSSGINSRVLGKIDYGSSKTITKIEIVGLSQSAGSNSSVGLYYSVDGTNWTQLGANLPATSTTPTTTSRTGSVTARYVAIILPAVNFTTANVTIQDLNGYEPAAGDMTLVTTSQTTDASVSNARVLIEFDNTATPALNTDLTAEVTSDNGANWATATLSAFTACSQGGRTVAETADTACTSGTSFAARIKTANAKNVPIYGVAITAH